MVPLKKLAKRAPQGSEATATIDIDSAEMLQPLLGEQDCNLRFIENNLSVTIGRTARGLVVTGQDADVELAVDVLVQLQEVIAQGEPLYHSDVERAVRLLAGDRKLRLADLLRKRIVLGGRHRTISPKTPTQQRYLEAIERFDLVFGVGPAGTGKTYLAMAMALAELFDRRVKRIVLCRPAVEAGERLGFLPGDMAEKVNPYLRPLYDALNDMVEADKAQELLERGTIEVAPLAFMRGRTLSRAFVILDEAQNTSQVQMKMLLTRLGPGSKCVITGDVSQIDLPNGVTSGLVEAVRILSGVPGIEKVMFSEADVIRHPLVAGIISAYETHGSSKN